MAESGKAGRKTPVFSAGKNGARRLLAPIRRDMIHYNWKNFACCTR